MAGSAAHPRHGGDLAFATARYGEPAGGWLDLSTGINPAPYPASTIAPGDFTRLPGSDALHNLIAAARGTYAVPDAVALAATPGSEIAIRLLPALAASGRVAIVAPTYATHSDAWSDAGHIVTQVAGVETIPHDAAFAVVGNPNNPDGRTTDPAVLVALTHTLGARSGFLVVDEAFADVAPEVSLVPHLSGLPAVVLRSIGKFYGLAGIRLGFVAGPSAIVDRLAAHLGAWPVSGPAIAIGSAALADDAWRDQTRTRLRAGATRLRMILSRHNIIIAGGTDLFVLVESGNAAALHESLARRGIWTRAFDGMPTHLRFGLPDEAGFARLDAALAAIA